MSATADNHHLLTVKDLRLDVATEHRTYELVSRVSFQLGKGKVLGIVGESGSGKTVTCMSLTRLLPQPPILYRGGEVWFSGKNLWDLPEGELRRVRGTGIGTIFQEAMSALNPVITVGQQVAEIFQLHLAFDKKKALQHTIRLFQQVGIPSPEIRIRHYPHQLSGGLQQRVMISLALAGNPQLLIADEPTTALDVTVQVQILALLKKLQQEQGMAIIFVSHDLGLIAEMSDRVLVMYAGEAVEEASTIELFAHPVHPYTGMLLKTIPHLGKARGDLQEIPGQVPSPANYPAGCKFHPRCPFADDICREKSPGVSTQGDGHTYRCWHPGKV